MEGQITGAWISPDRTKVTIQVDEDGLYQLEAGYTETDSVDMVPADWETLIPEGHHQTCIPLEQA
jgi:hypothetical protein